MSFFAIVLLVIFICVISSVFVIYRLRKALRKLKMNPLKMNREKKFWYIQALRSWDEKK